MADPRPLTTFKLFCPGTECGRRPGCDGGCVVVTQFDADGYLANRIVLSRQEAEAHQALLGVILRTPPQRTNLHALACAGRA